MPAAGTGIIGQKPTWEWEKQVGRAGTRDKNLGAGPEKEAGLTQGSNTVPSPPESRATTHGYRNDHQSARIPVGKNAIATTKAAEGSAKHVLRLIEEGSGTSTPVIMTTALPCTIGPPFAAMSRWCVCCLEHGADPNLRDKNGKTPLELATIGNRTEVAAVLKEHGAEM